MTNLISELAREYQKWRAVIEEKSETDKYALAEAFYLKELPKLDTSLEAFLMQYSEGEKE